MGGSKQTVVRLFFAISLICSMSVLKAQHEILKPNMSKIDNWQRQLDLIDGSLDRTIGFPSPEGTDLATRTYIDLVDEIQQVIAESDVNILDRKQMLFEFYGLLKQIDRRKYGEYGTISERFDMILHCIVMDDDDRLFQLLKVDLERALELIPFFSQRTFARFLLEYAAYESPSSLLKKMSELSHQAYFADILKALVYTVPLQTSYYMSSSNAVSMGIRRGAESDETLALFLALYEQNGAGSKSFLLLKDIQNGTSLKEAELFSRDRDDLFRKLGDLVLEETIIGERDIVDELRYISLRSVREINDLHEQPDTVRFALIDSSLSSAKDIYMLMVYGHEEIFTTTFLGMFNKWKIALGDQSIMSFLNSIGMHKYEVFLEMCVTYNMIPVLFREMSPEEPKYLFDQLCNDLRIRSNPLQVAVNIVDIYTGLDSVLRDQLRSSILEHKRSNDLKPEQKELYKHLTGILEIGRSTKYYTDLIAQNSTLDHFTYMGSDSVHIQQHFFYEDEDGWINYETFIQRFYNSSWQQYDHGSYVEIRSVQGQDVILYFNKPSSEIAGQKAIRSMFDDKGIQPDVIVHRGHSYYVSETISYIKAESELVFLGSCGGYDHLNRILSLSPGTQAITTRQVGLRVINDVLLLKIIENVRQGNDLIWSNIWSEVKHDLRNYSEALDQFTQYVAPHHNRSALLIKAYKDGLLQNDD